MLTKYKGNVYTSDTLEIVKKIETLILDGKLEAKIYEPEQPLSGRVVGIDSNDLKRVWSYVIPMGVTPWCRYPVHSVESDIYHVYGPWQTMMDTLMGMGRGDAVWSSFKTATAIECGLYEGENAVGCEIQMLLHRLGYNPGPVDGLIGPTTTRAMAEAGVKERAELALCRLRRMKPAQKNTPPAKKRKGYFSGDCSLKAVQTFGGVRGTRTESGLVIETDSPGRLILDLE